MNANMAISRGIIAAMALFFLAFPREGIFAEPLEDPRTDAGEEALFDFKSWVLDSPDDVPPAGEADPSGSGDSPPEEQDAHDDAEMLPPDQRDRNFLQGLERLPEAFIRPDEEVDPDQLRRILPPEELAPEEVDPDQLGRILPPEELDPEQPGATPSSNVQFSAFNSTYHRERSRIVKLSTYRGTVGPSFTTMIAETVQDGQGPPDTVPLAEEACDAARRLPFDLRRSVAFWRQTEDGANCSAAVKDIRSLREEMRLDMRDSLHDTKLFDPDYICASRNRFRRSIVQRYTDSCLYRLADVTHLELLSQEHQETILSAIGVIEGIGQRCIGTVSNGHLYTSRHCFLRTDSEGKMRLRFPSEDFHFHSFSGSKFKLAVPNNDGVDGGFIGHESDWIAVPFARNQDKPTFQIPIRPDLANEWRPLLMVSLHRYLAALSMCDGKTQSEEEFINASLVVEITPGCTIFAREGNIVYHGCQTQKGMSGTPLMTIDEDELVLVAIHSGSSSALQTPCAGKLAERFPNFGVVLQVTP